MLKIFRTGAKPVAIGAMQLLLQLRNLQSQRLYLFSQKRDKAFEFSSAIREILKVHKHVMLLPYWP
nr:hypothetical protein [Pseudovibrio sp. M1P-2-3]